MHSEQDILTVTVHDDIEMLKLKVKMILDLYLSFEDNFQQCACD